MAKSDSLEPTPPDDYGFLGFMAPGATAFLRGSRGRDPSLQELMDQARKDIAREKARQKAVDAPPLPPAIDEVSPAPKSGLYYLCFWCTWVVLAINVVEFLTGAIVPGSGPSAVYFAALSAYAADKELGKWNRPELGEQSTNGHIFVYVWVAFAILAPTLAAWFPAIHLPHSDRVITLYAPHDSTAIALEVLTVLAGSKISKQFRKGADIASKILEALAGGLELTAAQIADKIGEELRKIQRPLSALVKAGKVIRLGSRTKDPNTKYKLA